MSIAEEIDEPWDGTENPSEKFGLYGLTGERLKGYIQYCSKNNYNISDPRAQFTYVFEEFKNNPDLNYSRFKSASTVREALVAFYEGYLGMQLTEEELLTKEITAYELMDRFNES